MYQLHFHEIVSERPYKHMATELRLITGETVAEFRGFATFVADSECANMFFYLAPTELRTLAAAMLEAAERLEKLAQDAKVAV